MYFLGIDSSTANSGIAVLNEHKEVAYSNDFKGKAEDPTYFYALYTEVRKLAIEYKITAMAIEDQFMSANAATMKKLSRVSGIFLVIAGELNIPAYLVTPSQWRSFWVKESGIHPYDEKDSYKSKASYSKEECFHVLQLYFEAYLKNFKKDNDKADALGIAWACSQIYQQGGLPEKEKKKRKKKKPLKKDDKNEPANRRPSKTSKK